MQNLINYPYMNSQLDLGIYKNGLSIPEHNRSTKGVGGWVGGDVMPHKAGDRCRYNAD